MRFGYDINRKISVNFLVKNIMNNDYAIRIAKPNPPRSYTIQLNCKF
jgi:outer membrane cobalamin receptor